MDVTTAELTARIGERAGLDKAAVTRVLDALGVEVTAAVSSGGRVKVPGIATVEPAVRAARTGRNPQTGEALDIPETRYPKLTAVPALKRAVKDS